jgi:hypothetical protein
MQLSEFLNNLFREGRVTVDRALADFNTADLEASVVRPERTSGDAR